jgi:hypothetical protein
MSIEILYNKHFKSYFQQVSEYDKTGFYIGMISSIKIEKQIAANLIKDLNLKRDALFDKNSLLINFSNEIQLEL